jgi:hypothetical protein
LCKSEYGASTAMISYAFFSLDAKASHSSNAKTESVRMLRSFGDSLPPRLRNGHGLSHPALRIADQSKRFLPDYLLLIHDCSMCTTECKLPFCLDRIQNHLGESHIYWSPPQGEPNPRHAVRESHRSMEHQQRQLSNAF